MNDFQLQMMKKAGILTESQIRQMKSKEKKQKSYQHDSPEWVRFFQNNYTRAIDPRTNPERASKGFDPSMNEIGEPIDPKQVKAEKEIEKVKAISKHLLGKEPDILSYDMGKEAGVFHMLHRPKDTGPHPSKNEGIRDDWDKELAAQRAKESAEWEAFRKSISKLSPERRREELSKWIKSGKSSGATHDDIIQRQKPPTGRPKTSPDWDKPESIDEAEYNIRHSGHQPSDAEVDVRGDIDEPEEEEIPSWQKEEEPEIQGIEVQPKSKTKGTSSSGEEGETWDVKHSVLKNKALGWKAGSGMGMKHAAERPTMTMTREKDVYPQDEPLTRTATNEFLNVDVDKQKDSRDMFSKGKPEPKDDKDDSPVYHATWKDFGNMHTYNLRKDYPEHGLVKGSTVARTKLQKLGIAHPEPPVEVVEGQKEYYPKEKPLKLKKPTYSPKRHPIKQVGGKYVSVDEPVQVNYHDKPKEKPLGVISTNESKKSFMDVWKENKQ